MFLNAPSILFRCVASFSLALWGVSAHHDVLLNLADLDHHHDHHVVADHGHSHQGGHSHSSDPEHNHRDSIPLPDSHTDPITPNLAKVAVDGPKQVSDTNSWLLASVGFFLFGTLDSEIEDPPRLLDSDLDPPVLLLLAHSVQSNAPPVLS